MKKYILLTLLVVAPALAQESTAKFSNESEANAVVSGGNTEIKVYNVKTTNKYAWAKNSVVLGGHYTYGTNEEELSARNWDVNTRYDRDLNEYSGAFASYQYEQDKFRALIFRQNHDLGLKYKALRGDVHVLDFEAGYRFTREKSLVGETEDLQKSRYAVVYEIKTKKNWSFKSTKELILNHTESSDTIFTIEPSLNMTLTDKVSFKFGYRGVYDNEPNAQGLKKYDYQLTTGLIAKF